MKVNRLLFAIIALLIGNGYLVGLGFCDPIPEPVKAYAAQRFSEIQIPPKIWLSSRAKKLNFTVEMRGRNFAKLQESLAKTNIQALAEMFAYYTVSFDNSAIDSLVDAIKRKSGGTVFLKINPASIPKCENRSDDHTTLIAYIPLYFTSRSGSNRWSIHPDKIGIFTNWNYFEHGDEIMLLVDTSSSVEQAETECNRIHRQFEEKAKKVRVKYALDELNEAQAEAQHAELLKQRKQMLLQLLNRY